MVQGGCGSTPPTGLTHSLCLTRMLGHEEFQLGAYSWQQTTHTLVLLPSTRHGCSPFLPFSHAAAAGQCARSSFLTHRGSNLDMKPAKPSTGRQGSGQRGMLGAGAKHQSVAFSGYLSCAHCECTCEEM